MKTIRDYYNRIISLENLLEAWQEFVVGKRSRKDVQKFQRDLMANIIKLHQDLASGNYRHSAYSPFKISDPKPRNIHKARVRDRLLHKAIYRVLYPIWDKTFIFDSYSCRNNKGTHKAFARVVSLTRKISQNYNKPCFALKLDIKKFFDSVDHQVLLGLLQERIVDKKLLVLLQNIIESFSRCHPRENGGPDSNKNRKCFCSFLDYPIKSDNDRHAKGIPLGNLTSQLFANVYLDPLDKFVKHQLKARHYLRYADDFIFLANNSDELMEYLIKVNQFLRTKLKLQLHPDKIIFRKLNWGIDYVGYVALPHYSLPRRKTAKRIFRKLTYLKKYQPERILLAIPSYLGYLGHADAYNLIGRLLQEFPVVNYLIQPDNNES